MKNKKVAVVVPAYNAEKTINKCLNSLLNQTFKNFEIIVIDDGSQDSTVKIVKSFVNKNSNRIKLICQKNKGVSCARNMGIRHAYADYITFMDADDYVDQNYLETLIMPVYEKNVQLSICGYVKEEKQSLYKCKYIEKGCINVKDLYNQIFINNGIEGFVFNKLYNLSLIKKNNILFDSEIKVGEDLLFNIRYLQYINSVYVSEQAVYHYTINELSVTNSTKIGKKFDSKSLTILEAYNKIIDLIPNDLVKAKNDAEAQFANNASNILRIIYLSQDKHKLNKIAAKLRKIIIKKFKYILLTNIFDIKVKMKYIINIISPNFTALVWKISRFKLKETGR